VLQSLFEMQNVVHEVNGFAVFGEGAAAVSSNVSQVRGRNRARLGRAINQELIDALLDLGR